MKAAIIGSAALEYNGGAERNAVQIASILKSLGYDVTLFTPEPSEIKENVKVDFNYVNNAFNGDIFANKSINEISKGISIGFIGLFSFKNIYEKIKGYDLYYFVNPNFLFCNSLKYFHKNNAKPEVILGNHGTYFEILNKKFYKKILSNLLTLIIFRYLKTNTTKIQVQNDFQKNFYKKLGIPDNLIYEIPQCNIDFNNYKINDDNNFNILFLNKLTENKGLSSLEKLIKKSDFNINVAGYSSKLDTLREKYKNYSNVKFLGYINEEEKYRILSKSDVMLNLSKYESLSVSSIEGLASGLYLIGPDISGLNCIKTSVPDYVSIVKKHNVNQYINEIHRIRDIKNNNIENHLKLRENIKNSSSEFFDKSVINASLETMITENKTKNQNISIVTASLNEYDNIDIWLTQIKNLIIEKNIKNIDEVVIVDDGSNDGTIEKIEDFKKTSPPFEINLIKRNKKMGTVNAQITGARNAKNDYLIILDCDLQHPVKFIYNFVQMFNKGFDIIIGSRYIRGGKNNWGADRGVISRVATTIAHSFFPFTYNIKDPLSGYFLVKKKLISNLYPYDFMYKPLLYTLIFNNKNKKYIEIPIEMMNRVNGSSKIVTGYSKTVLFYSREILIYWRDNLKLKIKF